MPKPALRKDWTELFSCVAAVASAVAAVCALTVSCQERSTPYKSSLYAARWSAIKDYSVGSTKFQSEVARIQAAVPKLVDTEAGIEQLSDEQLGKISLSVKGISGIWQSYLETSNGAMGLWSADASEVFDRARLAGHMASDCYQVLGQTTDINGNVPDVWEKIRADAKKYCIGIHSGRTATLFDRAAGDVLRRMTDDLREDDNQFVPGDFHNAMD